MLLALFVPLVTRAPPSYNCDNANIILGAPVSCIPCPAPFVGSDSGCVCPLGFLLKGDVCIGRKYIHSHRHNQMHSHTAYNTMRKQIPRIFTPTQQHHTTRAPTKLHHKAVRKAHKYNHIAHVHSNLLALFFNT